MGETGALPAAELDDRVEPVDRQTNESTTSANPGGTGSTTAIDDGRSLRRRRNRDAVIRSLIELIQEGDLEPTVAKIAERAGVSHRSIFRYFDDLNDLARTAIETEMSDVLPIASIPDRGAGDFEHRVDEFIAARRRLWTRVHNLSIVAQARSLDIPEMARGLSTVAMMMHNQALRQFSTELDRLDPDEADSLAALISATTSAEAYDHQRRRLDRTDDEIFAGWRTFLVRLLG